MSEPRSVYQLEGLAQGRVLWLLAPGPSASPWNHYEPQIRASGALVLAVNSALEFSDPDFWMWSDKRFASIYGHEIHGEGDLIRAMVCPSHQEKVHRRFVGGDLWVFDYQMKLRPWEAMVGAGPVEGQPFWYSPTRRFLPGRASVVNNAMSLAWLLRPRLCVLAGVDWSMPGGAYYREGIKKNRGPTDRERALRAGAGWFRRARHLNLWPDLALATVSHDLAAKEKIRFMSWPEARDA